MKLAILILAGLAFSSAPAFADHGHGQKKVDPAEAHQDHTPQQHQMQKPGQSAGDKGDMMNMQADDHADHGTGVQGKDGAHDTHDIHSAHAMNDKTLPADGAVLQNSPPMIGVKFGHAMNVQAVTISTLSGEMIELDVADVGETDHVRLEAPILPPDDYNVDWRARGHDGHIMSGSFSFTVE